MMVNILLFLLILFLLQLNVWVFYFCWQKRTEIKIMKEESREGLPPTIQDLLGEL